MEFISHIYLNIITENKSNIWLSQKLLLVPNLGSNLLISKYKSL